MLRLISTADLAAFAKMHAAMVRAAHDNAAAVARVFLQVRDPAPRPSTDDGRQERERIAAFLPRLAAEQRRTERR